MHHVLILSLALNALLILFFVGKRIYYRYFRKRGYEFSAEDTMRAAAEIQGQLPIGQNDIVFVGTSLTANFPLHEFFPGLTVKNRGIGSNQLTHMLARIKPIAEGHPRMIFLEGGINDIAAGVGVNNVFSLYKQVVETIKQISPATQIIIQSTLPVSGTSLPLMPGVDELNQLLAEYANKEGVILLDLGKAMMKDSALDSCLTWDGVHLNYRGYERWREVVAPYLPYSFSISESRNSSSSAFK